MQSCSSFVYSLFGLFSFSSAEVHVRLRSMIGHFNRRLRRLRSSAPSLGLLSFTPYSSLCVDVACIMPPRFTRIPRHGFPRQHFAKRDFPDRVLPNEVLLDGVSIFSLRVWRPFKKTVSESHTGKKEKRCPIHRSAMIYSVNSSH